MPTARVGSIDIAYDMRGPAGAPAVLLIMGLGTQMIAWSDPFCDAIAAEGFRVVRFDNRDIGLSTKFSGVKTPNMALAFAKALFGAKVPAPYSLTDMAGDAVGLLDVLGLADAHVVGASMGGMIAQLVACQFRDRTRSLVSIMSSSGDRKLPQATRDARAALLAKRPPLADREAAIRHGMSVYRVIGSPAYAVSDAELYARIGAAISRSYYPEGVARQMLAILADGSRVARLRTITAPTLVIHGEADPLVPVEAGRHTAACIPGAILRTIPGMGHDLPPALVPTLAGLIAAHCKAADAAPAPRARSA